MHSVSTADITVVCPPEVTWYFQRDPCRGVTDDTLSYTCLKANVQSKCGEGWRKGGEDGVGEYV
jgi:hypothetical protein